MPRTLGQIDQAKRAAILAAARALIIYPPPPPPVLALDRVAQRAGVAKQTIYNHFGSKAALIEEMERELADQRLERLRA